MICLAWEKVKGIRSAFPAGIRDVFIIAYSPGDFKGGGSSEYMEFGGTSDEEMMETLKAAL